MLDISSLFISIQEVAPVPELASAARETALPAAASELPAEAALRWPDIVGLSVIGSFLVLGLVRGLWWQVIRLAGLLVAGLLARTLAPRFSGPLADQSGLPLVVSQGIVWLTVFVLALVAVSLLGMIGKKSLDAMQLGLVDRFGGGLAGFLTGVALQAALLVSLSYLGPQPWTADTLHGTRSEDLLRLVSGRLPVFVDRHSIAAREIRSWIGSDTEGQGEVRAGDKPLSEAAEEPQPLPIVPPPPAVDDSAPRVR